MDIEFQLDLQVDQQTLIALIIMNKWTGWSDFFTLIMTMKPSDLPETGRGIGTYFIGEDIDGAGIRPARYSTDFNVNNFTYGTTNDKLFINTNTFFGEVNVSLIDLNGRIVLSKKIDLAGGEIDIDISTLRSGLYILNVKGENLNRNDKIIKN